MRLWQWIKDLYAREPVMFNAVILSVVTSLVTWFASTGWLDLTDSQRDNLITWLVGLVIAVLSGGLITRQSVYAPASVVAAVDPPSGANSLAQVVAGPASPLPDGTPVEVEPYAPRHSRTVYSSDTKDEAAYHDPYPGTGQGPGGGG